MRILKEGGTIYLHAGFLQYLEQLNDEKRLVLLDEGLVIPGIGVRWVGGHSPCSQFIYINSDNGVATFTGDTIQLYGNVEHNDVIGIWYDDEQCWHALDMARASPSLLIPGHDPLVLEKYPGGIIARS